MYVCRLVLIAVLSVLAIGCSSVPIQEQAENFLDDHDFTPNHIITEMSEDLSSQFLTSSKIDSSLDIGLDPRPFKDRSARVLTYILDPDESDPDQCREAGGVVTVVFSGKKMIAAWKQHIGAGDTPPAYSLDDSSADAPGCASDS